jgi:hypothetical protein
MLQFKTEYALRAFEKIQCQKITFNNSSNVVVLPTPSGRGFVLPDRPAGHFLQDVEDGEALPRKAFGANRGQNLKKKIHVKISAIHHLDRYRVLFQKKSFCK